jgi:hypothetical protein
MCICKSKRNFEEKKKAKIKEKQMCQQEPMDALSFAFLFFTRTGGETYDGWGLQVLSFLSFPFVGTKQALRRTLLFIAVFV